MDFHPMPRYLMRKHAIRKILKKLPCKNKDLLEIGYGAGEIFSTYLQSGINCYGYDFSADAYHYAMANIKNNAGSITLYKKEQEINERKYDFVVACEVLEHMEDDAQALLDWKSHLKDEGMFLLSVPAHQNRWDYADISAGHFRRYEKDKLTELLYKSGLQVKVFYTYDFPSCYILDPIRAKRTEKIYSLASNTRTAKEDFTKVSGIKRDQNKFFRLLSNKYLLYPIIKFQELFYKCNLGSAYIILCEKIK